MSWMKDMVVVSFFFTSVNLNDPSHTHTHTPFTQPLLLTQDCVWFIGHRILALFILQIPPSLSYEKTMHSVESYRTDAFYESYTRSPVCKYISFKRPHTHTYCSHRGIWNNFPLFVYVLVCVVLGFGRMPWDAMLDVLSAHTAERIIECTGQGEKINLTKR